MSKNLFILFLLLLGTSLLSAQNQVTISGTISDGESGETLIGATIMAPQTQSGTTTNEYGFYSLTLPAGDSLTLEISYVGFQTEVRRVSGRGNTTLNVELSEGVQLEEVVVKANSFQEQMKSTEMSVEVITTKEVKNLPVLFGETDIIKIIQLKPGMPSASEGTTGLFVRGGGSDQNLIVLDEAIVYNANHLFGFFSTFNTDAVKDLKLYKGGFPAQYGGRLSSVIDIKLKDGNMKQFSGAGGIGLISSRLTLEGPIVKDKLSFIVSGRRTYFDLITRGVNKLNEDKENYSPIPDYYFYDLNTKVTWNVGEKDKIFLSGYFGRDVFGFNGGFFDFAFDWGNATGTARWNHIFNPKVFANTTFTFSDYRYQITNELDEFSFELGSEIQDINFKTDFYYAPNNRHTLRFGAGATYHQFGVGRLQAGSRDGAVSFRSGQDFDAVEMGVYVSDEWAVTPDLKINAGLRLSGFNNDSTFYAGLEPRIAANYSVSDNLSIKASYARMFQYLHLVGTAGATLPTDLWYPSTERVQPQRSDQVAAGYSVLLGDNFLFTNEVYYKWLQNQVDFVDGAELFANNELEEEFAIGKGYAYGAEFELEKKEGKLTGWIAYTLAWIRRGEFQTLNPDAIFGEGLDYFAPRYDRRHNVSVVAMYELSKRLTLSATWIYGSGDLYWLPVGRLTYQDVYGAGFEAVVPVFGERNTYRLIPFHRLDLGLVWRFNPKWGESDLTFNVINAYDRRNAFFVYLEPEFQEFSDGNGDVFEIPTKIAAKQVSLFPVLPSITYNFKF